MPVDPGLDSRRERADRTEAGQRKEEREPPNGISQAAETCGRSRTRRSAAGKGRRWVGGVRWRRGFGGAACGGGRRTCGPAGGGPAGDRRSEEVGRRCGEASGLREGGGVEEKLSCERPISLCSIFIVRFLSQSMLTYHSLPNSLMSKSLAISPKSDIELCVTFLQCQFAVKRKGFPDDFGSGRHSGSPSGLKIEPVGPGAGGRAETVPHLALKRHRAGVAAI